jgi:hypothetical protein
MRVMGTKGVLPMQSRMENGWESMHDLY